MTSTTDPENDEEYTLPSVDTLLAGTLALMTGCAHGANEHRGLMLAKIANDPVQLSEPGALSADMRRMVAHLQTRWPVPGSDRSAYSAEPGWLPASRTLP